MPPAVGSWGAGRPYDPAAAQPAALRLLTGEDWRPALRALIAPTAVLLLAALIAAIPDDYGYSFYFEAPGFDDRFGSALAMALAALGAPFRLSVDLGTLRGAGGGETTVRLVPMTVTAAWLFALWLGLRAGARARQARTGEQQTRRQAAGEALRTALVAGGVTLLLGLVAGAEWHPGGSRGSGRPGDFDYGSLFGRASYTTDAGWLQAAGWTALLAGLLAFAVHGTDALRWAAWRNRAVRGWAVAGLSAGRALAFTVGLSSLAAFVLIAAQGEGWQTGASVAFLPNAGLLLLGLGSGATLRGGSDDGRGGSTGPWGADGGADDAEFSFFDLHGESADWRWTGLLALAATAYLGWTAYRRRLDAADRLRLAAIHAVGLTLLMTVAGALVSSGATSTYSGRSRDLGQEYSAGLLFGTVLAANAVWAAVGALALPPLLTAVRGGAPGGPVAAVPPQGGPPDAAGLAPGSAPASAPGHVAEPFAPGLGVSEVIGSHGEDPTPPAAPPAGQADTPSDPSVWRKHP
ncbi:hypothetical protein [Kitasatospora sp. NPDC090091]|uniref:hypothetical protein n=1 Tax=Kitasatospora sp. NPDC090091 TaxID=3364081 RepID=UPI00382E229E